MAETIFPANVSALR